MQQVSIRPATLTDAGAISQLIIPLVKEFIAHEYSRHGQQTMINSMTDTAIRHNLRRGFEYLVAEVKEKTKTKMVGVLAIKNKNHIYHLFVDRDYHKQKIAKQLWTEYLSNNSSQSFTVNSSKYAVGFYQSIGFEPTDEIYEKEGVTCYPMIRKVEKETK